MVDMSRLKIWSTDGALQAIKMAPLLIVARGRGGRCTSQTFSSRPAWLHPEQVFSVQTQSNYAGISCSGDMQSPK